MRILDKKTLHRGTSLFMGCGEFFVLLFLYIWLRIRPELIYHGLGGYLDAPLFNLGWQFFKDHLTYPGGVLEYASGFLSQCYYFSWLGALILTTVAWGLARCTAALIASTRIAGYRFICCIPAILLLIACNNYTHPLTTFVALLTALAFFVAYKRIAPHSSLVQVALFTIMLIALYHIAAGASLLFVVLSVIHEILTTRRNGVGLVCLLIGLAVPWLFGAFLIGVEPVSAYLYLLPFHPGYAPKSRIILCCLWLFVPAVMLLIGIWENLIPAKAQEDSSEAGRLGLSWLDRVFRRSDIKDPQAAAKPRYNLQIRILIIIAIVICFFTFEGNRKIILQMNYLSRHKMWPQLLQTAERIKSQSPHSVHDVNRALYHTGRLGEEMFRYPQTLEALLLFPGPEARQLGLLSPTWALKLAEICIELGDLNLAEHLICEALEQNGAWPVFLENLALINMVKGDITAGRAFLKALSKNPVYARQAKETLARLDRDPQLKSDDEIQHLRSVMWVNDHAIVDYRGQWMLEELMKSNKHNKMAFEYLMAYYMLTGELEEFVKNLPRLDDFGYRHLPRHYQEAILVYTGITREPVDLGSRTISNEIKERYKKFEGVCEAYRHDKVTAGRTLAVDFGRSYFFYYTFGVSGIGK
jgi:hypothetical protein